MSASSQSYPHSALPAEPLTITEVEIEPSPVLGKSNIYLCAVIGALVGVLAGIALAASLALPQRIGRQKAVAGKNAPLLSLGAAQAAAVDLPAGPRDFGTAEAKEAGLRGHLTAEWKETASYRLVVEPMESEVQPGFELAVAGSKRPLSVGFQLMDAAGTVLCRQNAVVRFDAARSAAFQKPASVSGTQADLASLQAAETAREHGHDVFENEIGSKGEIAAIEAEGALPCTRQAYAGAAGWSLSADFPSVAEQAELVRQAHPSAVQKAAHSPKSGAEKKTEPHKLTASLDSFVVPKGPGQ